MATTMKESPPKTPKGKKSLPADGIVRNIFFDVIIENLLEVSSSAQTFAVRFWLDIELDLTEAEVKKFLEDSTVTPLPLSDAVIFNNAIDISSHKIYPRMDGAVGRLEGNRFYQRALISGTFQEEMELGSFPFDIQELTIKFVMNPYDDPAWSWSEVAPGMRFQVPSGEWLIPQATWDRPEDSWIGVDMSDEHVATVKILVARNWVYYINHYVSVLMMITGMLPFSFKFSSLAEMLGFISTMFLAGVALLFVLEPALPKQKDLTLMDKYVYWSFIFSFLTAVLGFVVEMESEDERAKLSGHMMLGAFGFWGISHILFAIAAACMLREEQKKLVFERYKGQFKEPRCKMVHKGHDGFLEPYLSTPARPTTPDLSHIARSKSSVGSSRNLLG